MARPRPRPKPGPCTWPLLVVALLLPGCTRPWQTAHTMLEAGARGVVAADTAVVDAYEASDCPDAALPEELRECVATLEAQVRALRIARAWLFDAEALTDVWRQAATEPTEWQGWLVSAASVATSLIDGLEASGVAVPEELLVWSRAIGVIAEQHQEEP